MSDWRDTSFTRRTKARLPIVAGPMSGGPTTTRLVLETCRAGGFGMIAGAYTTPDDFRRRIRYVRENTDAPFGANVLLGSSYVVDDAQIASALRLLEPYARELGIELSVPTTFGDDVDALIEVAIDERVAFFSFTFGVLDGALLDAFRANGTITCGTATSVAEARALEASGVDMIVLQGGEAGGHRGTFIGDSAGSVVSLVPLMRLVSEAVDVPLVAAGGIMDGRAIAGVLELGAVAAQLGTAFLLTNEAGTSAPYRDALRGARETDTVITKAFSGRAARGLRNRMTEDLQGADLPPYPVMNALTRPLRRAAAEQGRAEFLSLWAGQGVPAAREISVAELMATLERETDEAMADR